MGFGITAIAIISVGGFYVAIGVLGMMWARARQRRAEMQVEVQTKLIDRFGSAPELIDFLQSSAGRQFVDGFRSLPQHAAREKILSGLRRGIITTLIGVAFLIIFAIDVRENRDCIYPATLILALGIGFFVSTWISMKLSRTWGLIDDAPVAESRT